MKTARQLCNNIEARLRVIKGLASMLIDNDSFRTMACSHTNAQLEPKDEIIVHEAVHLLADQAQDELIDLMDVMEVPV